MLRFRGPDNLTPQSRESGILIFRGWWGYSMVRDLELSSFRALGARSFTLQELDAQDSRYIEIPRF